MAEPEKRSVNSLTGRPGRGMTETLTPEEVVNDKTEGHPERGDRLRVRDRADA